MTKSKMLLFIFIFIIIVGIFRNIFGANKVSKKSDETPPTIEFMNEKYYSEWREPDRDELYSISIILTKNHTSKCANFYVINTRSNEYVVACTSDEKEFNYYGVWVSSKESGKLSDDIITVYKTPNNHIK